MHQQNMRNNMYYVISENFFNNNSSILLDDRCEFYSDIDSPKISIQSRLNACESENEKNSIDFHLIGEIIAHENISKIISKHNPFNIQLLPISLDGKDCYTMISINNPLSCLDVLKSDIIKNPFYPSKSVIKELYIDIKKLNSYEEHLTKLFTIKEAHDYILVNQDIGKELLDYIEKNPNTSLIVKAVSEHGEVPKVI